jgi:uncharacterized membrane protein YkvA (DUF1232 family)
MLRFGGQRSRRAIPNLQPLTRNLYPVLLGMMKDLNQFILDGARRVTPRYVGKLVRQLPEIRLVATQVTQFPQLADQVEFLAELIEDFHSGLNQDVPYTAIAEAAFALSYLHKGVDIIPDRIPDIGYADDAAIITVVFETYKEAFLRLLVKQEKKRLARPSRGS